VSVYCNNQISPGPLSALETQQAVQLLYAREGHLLDRGEFEAWLELFAPEVHYWMPTRSARFPREQSRQFEPEGSSAHFDENHADLAQRIRKVRTGRAWSEVPASRTRHLISNIVVYDTPTRGLLIADSSFIVYRTRSDTYQDTFAGGRRDHLHLGPNGSVRIAHRVILLDQTVVLGNNLSVFF
jgi:3-phenylpropionate/cinnamic acid dioxygenase small subunit